ncbi:amidohydrolase [Umbelopsis sp. AD052]|nr:amidohydrolase [Umbelopsis sp. AD052]
MLYYNADIVTMNADRHIIADGAILVKDNRIADIGKTKALKEKYPEEETYDFGGKLVIPGLIDTHVHLAQSLLRGCADDKELIQWLCQRVWVLQGCFEEDDGYVAAKLCIAEMLKSGTTTFLEAMCADRYNFSRVANAVEESGIRACLGKIVMDIGTYTDAAFAMHPGLIETREQSLLGTLAMHEKWHGKANDRIHVWFGSRTPGGVSVELFKEMTQISQEKDIRITMHCAEVEADKKYFREEFDMSPMEFCDHVGLLSDKTVLVHMVWIEEKDIKMLASSGTHVSHNPTSNCKLASGIAKVPMMLEHKVNVSMGCDGSPCNNDYDMIREMKLAAILHKAVSLDPTVMPAEQVLEMATLNGAKALGLEKEIGSLEVGKKADFVAVDLNKLHTTPSYNPVSTLVYAATGGDVDTVVVDGKIVVQKGELLTINEEEIRVQAKEHADALYKRAGIVNKPIWPVV